MLGKISFFIARNLRTFNYFMCIVNTQGAMYQSNSAPDNKITLIVLFSRGFESRGWELLGLLEGS